MTLSRQLVLVENNIVDGKIISTKVVSSFEIVNEGEVNVDSARLGYVNLEGLPSNIRDDIEDYMEENPSERSDKLSPMTAFNYYLTWNGIIGYPIAKAFLSILGNTKL